MALVLRRAILCIFTTTLIITSGPAGTPALADDAVEATVLSGDATTETNQTTNRGDGQNGPSVADAPKTLEREQRFMEGETPPGFEQSFMEKGSEYRLISVSEPVEDSDFVVPVRYYQRFLADDVALADIDTPGNYFPSSIYVEDGPFAGNIGLASAPYETQGIYESFEGQVDRRYTIFGLPDNDVKRLPGRMDFEVSSDVAPGATQVKTLDLLSVEYEVTGSNALGLPNEYTAHLIYRGQQSWLELHHYRVTAHYAGALTSSERQYVVRAHYEMAEEVEPPVTEIRDPRPAASVAVIAPEVFSAAGEPEYISPLALITAIIAIISAVALLLLWLFLWRKNATLISVVDGRRHVLMRRQLLVAGGKATFKIPENIQPPVKGELGIELKPALANQNGELSVAWHDRVIVRSRFKSLVGIDLNVMESKEVLAAITEAVIGMEEGAICKNKT